MSRLLTFCQPRGLLSDGCPATQAYMSHRTTPSPLPLFLHYDTELQMLLGSSLSYQKADVLDHDQPG